MNAWISATEITIDNDDTDFSVLGVAIIPVGVALVVVAVEWNHKEVVVVQFEIVIPNVDLVDLVAVIIMLIIITTIYS